MACAAAVSEGYVYPLRAPAAGRAAGKRLRHHSGRTARKRSHPLAQAGIPESEVGVYVHDLTTDLDVLSFGTDRALNPASALKLLTTFAALDLLGQAYTWKTEAWLDGTLDRDRLNGNLVLKRYSDPKFNFESLWLFLRNRGLRDIGGDLVLDRSFFAIEDHDPALFDNEPSRPYNVGADALLINYKTFRSAQSVQDALLDWAHGERISRGCKQDIPFAYPARPNRKLVR